VPATKSKAALDLLGGLVTATCPALTAESAVFAMDGGFVATNAEPWLPLAPHPELRSGSLVEITYRTSFWDEPVRPVFRFHTSLGDWHDRIAPAPVAGTATFKTRIPNGTTAISVSPTCRIGRFDFEITDVRRLSFVGEALRAARHKPRHVRSAILTRLIGWHEESDVNLAWASASTSIAHYDRWRRVRSRDIDLGSIDAPRCDWTTAAKIRLFVDAGSAPSDALAATIDSVKAQVFPHWQVDVVTDREFCGELGDPRIRRIEWKDVVASLGACGPRMFIAAVAPGARYAPYAFAALAEAQARRPEVRIFYGDEEFPGDGGRLVPVFKPGWSPLLEAEKPYLGAAVFLRADLFAGWTDDERLAFVRQAGVPRTAAAWFAEEEVATLRRIVLTGPRPSPRPERKPLPRSEPIVRLPDNPSAMIVIPTRDRADLLGRCIASIFAKTAFSNFSIVIVDNESVEPETKRLFDHFRGDRNVSVLHSPGPFNFSALCNAAAARRKCDVLVFLNNDTEVLSENWLGRLVISSLLPDVGAVGGVLFYPDGRIQHAGVVLGMGNSAGHFGAGLPATTPGWHARHEAVHEISAVTGACLAVARRKFMQIGGFDAANLPVELGDIDLCLRLREKGWRSRLDPEVRLVHKESASRKGATFRRLAVYAAQRRWFHSRWLHALRDDPYFHPGLSLYDCEPALG
jgi:GT2 family glycosyltransferase